MPRYVQCKKCGYEGGTVDRGDKYWRCPRCKDRQFIAPRDFKEDHSEFHKGVDPRPKADGRTTWFDVGRKTGRERGGKG